jgi:hypothetical protein
MDREKRILARGIDFAVDQFGTGFNQPAGGDSQLVNFGGEEYVTVRIGGIPYILRVDCGEEGEEKYTFIEPENASDELIAYLDYGDPELE